MGTTAEKLTYLNDTKEDLKDTINYTGANIGTNDTFRSYATKLKQGYLDILNNGIDTLYNNFPKVSGIGSNLSLTPTYKAPIKLNEIQGNTLQNGTPTPDTPVEIQSVTGLQNIEVCGKNLLDFSYENIFNKNDYATPSKIDNGFRITSNTDLTNQFKYVWFKVPSNFVKTMSNKTVTLSMNATATNDCVPVVKIYYVSSSNRLTTQYGSTITANGSHTITLPADLPNNAISYAFVFYLHDGGKGTTGTYADFSNIQLEIGSTATTYEPYKVNTYEVNLGKNLIKLEDGTFTDGANLTITIENQRVILNGTTSENYLWINLTKKDYRYGTPNISNKPLWFNEEIIPVGQYIGSSTNNLLRILYTDGTNSTGAYVSNSKHISGFGLYIGTSGTTFNNQEIQVQLEKGSTSTSYSPYFTPIELNKIGDYKDRIYKDNGKWYVEKNIGKVVLDGSNDENWGTWFSTTGVYYSANYISSLTDSADTINCICDKYQANTRAYLRNNLSTIDNVCAVNGGELILANKSITSVSDFKNWLSNNNVIMYYVYARSVAPKIVITNNELIEQLELLNNAKSKDGTTNINVTSEDLSMLLNVSVLKGE